MGAMKKLEKRVKRYLPVELDVDTSYLNNTQEQVLESLINAAAYMDDIFEMQAWKGSKEKREHLEDEMDWNKLARLQLQYWDIMKGPWDRTDENKPFAIDRQKPEGAGFYSEDLSFKEFKVWMQLHPDQRQALESPVTVVKRVEQAAQYPVPLEAVPYSEEYGEYLGKASEYLKEAADKTDNPSLAKFLGPKYVGNDESKGEIGKVLGSAAPPLQEATADVMGVWNMLYKFNNGDLPADLRNRVLFTYITSLLRSVRFGTDSSQGLAAAVQLNQYLEENAIIQLDQKAGKDQGKFQVNFKKLENS